MADGQTTTIADKNAATADTTASTTKDTTQTTTDQTKDTGGAATVLDTAKTGDTDKTATAQLTWPADWREKMAAGDEKELKRLQRFTSPEAANKSWRALETKISSGEYKQTLAKDAKPEEVAAWRKDNGIPEKPEGYLEKLPDGIVVGEEDKPLLNLFVSDMHNLNASPDVVHAAIQSYYKVHEQATAEMAEQDANLARETEDSLRAEFGGEYRSNINALTGYLDTLPKELSEGLKGARLANGQPLFANLEASKWFINLVREINPASTVVPGAGADAGKSIDAEIKGLEAQMGDKKSAYWKDDKLQARYRELIDARDRMKSRA